ncbi:MAG: ATP-binding protein [Nanoarchaeota archaeon]
MITEQTNRHIEKIGEFTETAFSIKNNGKAFRILVSNLYSDKVKAAISELSANALDSHIEAENGIPFEVSLPSNFEPIFSIRDFGIGMSHEFMMNGYSIAFHSSKDTSNLYNGEKGLGRLSALSLCDSYVCANFQNGEKRTYSVFINETGVPSIVHLGTEETTEPNGFYIEIPIPQDKICEFDEKALYVYSHYKPKPIIKNRLNFVIPDQQYVILAEDGSWGIKKNSCESMAIMSAYSYPINKYSIPNLNENELSVLNSGIVIHFNLGELNTSANREALEYNNTTINSIKNKLASILIEIEKVILCNFEGKTGFEQMEKFGELFEYNGELAKISGLSRSIVKKLKIPEYIVFNGFAVNTYNHNSYSERLKKSISTSFTLDEKTVFYFWDKKSYQRERAKEFFKNPDHHGKKISFVFPLSNDAIENFKNIYGIDVRDFPKASSLPFNKPHYVKGKVAKSLIFVGISSKHKNMWKEDIFDRNENVIYVERRGYKANYYSHTLQKDIDLLNSITGEKPKVWGLTPKQIETKESHWIEIRNFLNEKVREYASKIEDKVKKAKYFDRYYGGFPESVLKELSTNGLCFLIYEEYKEFKQCKDEVGYDITEKSTLSYENMGIYSTEKLREEYPLLFLVKGDNLKYSKKAIEQLNLCIQQ